MQNIPCRLAAFSCCLVLVLLSLVSAHAQTPPVERLEVRYTVSMSEPATHLFEVSMRIANIPAGTDSLDLVMPTWAPGSYLIREFGKHVQDFSAVAPGPNGDEPVRWVKVDKTAWRVWLDSREAGARTGELRVTYRVYANELSVRTSHLDDSHGYINGATVFLYVDGFKDVPCGVTFRPPPRWKVATGLTPDRGANPDGTEAPEYSFSAPNYDVLVDCPVEIGEFHLISFEAFGKPHEIAIWGRGSYDPNKLRDDFRKIVEATAAIFENDVPYDRYVFIVHLYSTGGGGLEHANSTTVQATPFIFQKKEPYQNFLELVAHEYFHLWVVKRIRPVALGPFDYKAENYTRMLWLMEGTTDYYAPVILQRAGLMTEDAYYKELAGSIKALQETPGRTRMSLEDASFDAWIKFYRRNEHSVNDQVSYYLKGYVVSAMLDLDIRGRTKGEKSLDTVLRLLWRRHGKTGQPVPENGIQPAVEEAAGGSFAEFFDRYVRGTAEIDYNAFLAHAGRKLVTEIAKDDARIDPSAPGAWLGANLSDANGRATITSVQEGSPAWKAGLNANDEVLAIDNVRTTAATLAERMADRKPGDIAVVTVFRRDELRTISVKLGERPPDSYKIVKLEKKADPAGEPKPAGRPKTAAKETKPANL